MNPELTTSPVTITQITVKESVPSEDGMMAKIRAKLEVDADPGDVDVHIEETGHIGPLRYVPPADDEGKRVTKVSFSRDFELMEYVFSRFEPQASIIEDEPAQQVILIGEVVLKPRYSRDGDTVKLAWQIEATVPVADFSVLAQLVKRDKVRLATNRVDGPQLDLLDSKPAQPETDPTEPIIRRSPRPPEPQPAA